MKFLSSGRFLAIYSGVLTIAFAVTVFTGFSVLQNPHYGILTARRINIVEPDGTVRLTLSNRADFPGGWVRGKEYPRPDQHDAAGLLFMSEEGTEQGGLIWGAHQNADGSIESHGHLSLDQYEENQVFAVDAGREGDDRFSQISVIDQGDYPIQEKRDAFRRITKLPPEQQDAAWNAFFAAHPSDRKRLTLGRDRDGSVGLDLKDAAGKSRIRLEVLSDGRAALRFLDAEGKVTREFTGAEK